MALTFVRSKELATWANENIELDEVDDATLYSRLLEESKKRFHGLYLESVTIERIAKQCYMRLKYGNSSPQGEEENGTRETDHTK